MPGPKIIFVNRVYWPNESATAQLLTDLAEGLAARGHRVHVIAAGTGATQHGGVTIHRTGGPDAHGGMGSRATNYLRFLARARRVLATLAERGDTVVLKTDPPMLAAAATTAATARGARVIQWIQDIYPEIVAHHSGAWLAPLLAPLRHWRNRGWQASAACVVVGADMRDTVEHTGVASARVFVQPNWAPRELEAPALPAEIAAQRAAWGLADKFIVAYSGNLGRVHEFTTLLGAAALLRDDTRVALVFVGRGPRHAEVRAAAEAGGLRNVHFFPPTPRPQLAASLAAADAHAVTLRPGFERLVNPSKLAGVLAAGRAALFIGPTGSRIAGLLRDEQCGAAIAPGDAAALATTLRAWSSGSHDATAARRANARASFERHFRFAAQLDAWERLLVPAPHAS